MRKSTNSHSGRPKIYISTSNNGNIGTYIQIYMKFSLLSVGACHFGEALGITQE
jgi:hypothetical protein